MDFQRSAFVRRAAHAGPMCRGIAGFWPGSLSKKTWDRWLAVLKIGGFGEPPPVFRGMSSAIASEFRREEHSAWTQGGQS